MKQFCYKAVVLFFSLFLMCCEQSGVTNVTTQTGDDASDFVDNETWNSTINIEWNGTDVTVTGSADGVTVSHENGYVTVNSTVKNIEYSLSGKGSGQLTVYSSYKFKLSLNGLTLTCPDGPAINNQSSKTCYVVLGSDNVLTDGSTYASSPEDRKAALFSEGQICFSGSGSLTVTGNYKHAVASDDYIRLCSGLGGLNLTAKASDGLHANDGVIINDGTVVINALGEGIQCDTSSVVITGGSIVIISTGDKGILAYGNVEISGGTTYITSYSKCIKTQSNFVVTDGVVTAICSGKSSSGNTPEGIEAKGAVTISGGQIYARAADDAVNSGGDCTITGGYVMAYSTGNDGLDANGNCYINGGVVYAIGASGAEVGIDANSEGGKKLYVQGGTLVAIGGLESGASLSQTCYQASSWSQSTWYALYDGSEAVLAFKTPSSGGTPLVVSTSGTASLKSGVTAVGASVLSGNAYVSPIVSGGSSVTLSSYSGGNTGGNPGGDRPGGGGPGGF